MKFLNLYRLFCIEIEFLDNNMQCIQWDKVHTIVFDFDGVFTDNKVYVDAQGNELVRCDRADGLGLDMLREFTQKNDWGLNTFILSTESNPVVTSRAHKMKLDCYQGVDNKLIFIKNYLLRNRLDFGGLVFLGNDLNDLSLLRLSGFSVAPSDAHPAVKDAASVVLNQQGGSGFVRKFIELLIGY